MTPTMIIDKGIYQHNKKEYIILDSKAVEHKAATLPGIIICMPIHKSSLKMQRVSNFHQRIAYTLQKILNIRTIGGYTTFIGMSINSKRLEAYISTGIL